MGGTITNAITVAGEANLLSTNKGGTLGNANWAARMGGALAKPITFNHARMSGDGYRFAQPTASPNYDAPPKSCGVKSRSSTFHSLYLSAGNMA
jgi:hypothetical protein